MGKTNEANGDDTTSQDGPVAQRTADKTANSNLLTDIALDLDASEKTVNTVREGLAGNSERKRKH